MSTPTTLPALNFFLIHGWDRSPEADWFPWLKRELELDGHTVFVPEMPHSEAPVIQAWVETLASTVKKAGNIDEHTFFVGHSIGCQTILRYLEVQPEDVHVGGVVLVAPWTHLKPAGTPNDTDKATAKPWFETPINWEKVKQHVPEGNFVAIFSDNDPFVPLSEKDIFEENLDAKTIVLHECGHISKEDDGILELPLILDELKKMIPQFIP